MIRWLVVWFVVLFTCNSAWAKCDAGETKMMIGIAESSEESVRVRSAKLLQSLVNSEMQGKACLEVLMDPEQYSDKAVVAKIALGEMQLAAPRFSSLATEFPAFSIFSLPFGFEDQAAVNRFQSDRDVVRVLANSTKDKAIILGFWNLGFHQFSAKKSLIYPEDLQGLKFYSQSEGSNRLARVLKSVPIQVSTKDVLTSLKEGRIEARSASWGEFVEGNGHLFQATVSETNHIFDGFQLIASPSWWLSLDSAIKKDLSIILLRATQEANQLTTFRASQAKRKIMRSDKTVHMLTRKQRARWRLAADTEISAIANRVGDELVNRARLSNYVR